MRFRQIMDQMNESLGSPLNDFISDIVDLYDAINTKLISGKCKVVPEDVIEIPNTNYKGELHTIKLNLNDIFINKLFHSKKQYIIINVYNVSTSEDNVDKLNRVLMKNTRGYSLANEYDKVENKTLKNRYVDDRLNLVCFSINKRLSPLSFFTIFYHEFNHLFRNYSEIRSSYSNINYIEKTNIYNSIYDSLVNENIDGLSRYTRTILGNIFYYLLNDDELNAFSTQFIAEYIAARVNGYSSFRIDSYIDVIELVEELELYIDNISYINANALKDALFKIESIDNYKRIGIDITKNSEYVKKTILSMANKQLQRLKYRLQKCKDRLFIIDEKFNSMKNSYSY